jgi:hypothetical protein
MLRKGTCVIAGLAVVLAAGCGSGGSSSGSGSETVTLSEQNGSGESGTATLTKEGDKTKVVLELQGSPAMAEPQPAHIHTGSCAMLDPTPKYALADVKDGKSTTTVDAKLDDLRNGAFSINVHQSAADIQTYVACGDVGSGSGGSGGSSGKY